VECVRRVVVIVEALGSVNTELSLNEVVQLTGIHRSSTYRTLESLVHAGWVKKNPETWKYTLGPSILKLKTQVLDDLGDKAITGHAMQMLNEISGETVTVSIIDEMENLVIEVLESQQPVKLSARRGYRIPLNTTASSRVLVAYLSEHQLQEVERKYGHIYFLDELASIRANGYAVSSGELDADASAIAAPIKNADDNVVGALGVCGPSSRFGPERMQFLIREVIEAARTISRNLGWND
jgi:IclR family KDG regulon transcriptional repressor